MDSWHKLDQLTVVVLLSYYHFLPDLTHQSTSKFLPSEARFQNLLSWRKQKEDEHLKSDREGGWNVEGSGFFSCRSANKQGRWFGEQGVASPPSFPLLSGLLPAFLCKKPIDQGAHSGVSTTLINVTHFNPNYISPSESLPSVWCSSAISVVPFSISSCAIISFIMLPLFWSNQTY